MTLTDFTSRPHAASAPRRSRVSLATLFDVWRSRRALARLDTSALSDIGVDPSSAMHEAAKPIWDVPATWRR